MKHVDMSHQTWRFAEEPFPAIRVNLSFGRNQNDRAFIPVRGVEPKAGVLPEGQFKVIKTREKGTILVVGGQDDTDRVLLFVANNGGFRGGVRLVEHATTGNVLTTAWAGNATHSCVAVAAILATGEYIIIHSFGRNTNDIYQYLATADGEIVRNVYSLSEWNTRNVSADDADEL